MKYLFSLISLNIYSYSIFLDMRHNKGEHVSPLNLELMAEMFNVCAVNILYKWIIYVYVFNKIGILSKILTFYYDFK